MRIHENGQVEIDGIDKLILNAFMDNANIPVSQLAKELGISNTAVHQRIKKLETSSYKFIIIFISKTQSITTRSHYKDNPMQTSSLSCTAYYYYPFLFLHPLISHIYLSTE